MPNTIVPSITPYPGPGDVRGYLVKWGPMANGDVGAPFTLLGFSDRSVQVEGTFGAGGTVEIQGCIDGSTYRPMHDALGQLLQMNAAGDHIRHIMEIVPYLRPSVTAGDGTTSITVTICMGGGAAQLSIGGSQ